MKKVLVVSIALATLANGAQADVTLPGGGVDGWGADGQLYRGAVLQQGYLTLSDSNNHFVNPAYSLNLQDSLEANMLFGGNFSGGGWTELFGQNVGIYVGRNTDDGQQYLTQDTTPTSLLDAYWADEIGLGDLGIRLNLRAFSSSEETNVQDQDETSTKGGIYESNLTTGLNLDGMPLEVTAHLGLRFGSLTDLDEPNNTRTELGVDSGLRWGATGKYFINGTDTSRNLVAGYIGGGNGSYDFVTETIDPNNTTGNFADTYSTWSIGIVASHERMLSASSRLVASAGLDRTSSRNGFENRQADPTTDDYIATVSYGLPIALGVEVTTSDRTTLSSSLSSNLYSRTNTTEYEWDGEEAVEEENTSSTWGNNGATVRIGLDREFAEGLNGRFVINQGILNNDGLAGPLVSQAQLSYRF